MYELFADPEVDIVLNITRPYEHYEVTKAALLAGKHVYSEKPLAPTLKEARELIALADKKGLYLGGAPDTFMGAGLQTCRRLIDDGYIGDVTGFRAHMLSHGPDHWHQDPEFFYKKGGGPMFDMGPYYVTMLINFFGRLNELTAFTKITNPQRVISSKPNFGKIIDVEVSTTQFGVLNFDSGVIGSLFTTFDVYHNEESSVEIYGSDGTLRVPDPNTYGGPVRLLRKGDLTFYEIPLMFDYRENSRALGLADMAKAIGNGGSFRADYKQQYHVLEIMSAFDKSSDSRSVVKIESPYTRPAPMEYRKLHGML